MKINQLLNQTVNQKSLMSIHFLDLSLNNFIDQLTNFINLIFAGNGLYICVKNNFGYIIDKIKSVNYSNLDLFNINQETTWKSNCPKPSLKILNEIIQICKYVCDKSKNEILINLYYNIKSQNYTLEIARQKIDGASVEYSYESKYENSENYIRYLQLHSHNTMSANFSSIDNEDESHNILCFYGVIGKINSETEIFNFDHKFRIWSGQRFIPVKLKDIFDISFLDNYKLQNSYIKKLNKIIEESDQEKYEKIHKNVMESLWF